MQLRIKWNAKKTILWQEESLTIGNNYTYSYFITCNNNKIDESDNDNDLDNGDDIGGGLFPEAFV